MDKFGDPPIAGEHDGARHEIPETVAAGLLRRIEARIRRRETEGERFEEPLYDCADCHASKKFEGGWIIVPCMDSDCLCSKVKSWHGQDGHQVARACLTCERGIDREAGIWFRTLYRRDRKGKPEIVESQVKRYERAMLQLGPAAKRVQLALDSIIEREKAGPVKA